MFSNRSQAVDEFESSQPMQKRSRLFINFLLFKSTNTGPAIPVPSVPQLALHCSRSILQLQYWTDVKRCDFGYRFGYRHQFALISATYAKLQVGRGLAGSLITLNYAYLS